MIPASFEESNLILGKPSDMEECDPLSVFSDGKHIVSCWKLTVDELIKFQKTNRIWLIISGPTMPPVILTAIKPLQPHA